MSFCCCHGNGSDGRHVCTKYHGHTHYYQATMLEIVINCLRLFFVVAMAMVVMDGMGVQNITAIGVGGIFWNRCIVAISSCLQIMIDGDNSHKPEAKWQFFLSH